MIDLIYRYAGSISGANRWSNGNWNGPFRLRDVVIDNSRSSLGSRGAVLPPTEESPDETVFPVYFSESNNKDLASDFIKQVIYQWSSQWTEVHFDEGDLVMENGFIHFPQNPTDGIQKCDQSVTFWLAGGIVKQFEVVEVEATFLMVFSSGLTMVTDPHPIIDIPSANLSDIKPLYWVDKHTNDHVHVRMTFLWFTREDIRENTVVTLTIPWQIRKASWDNDFWVSHGCVYTIRVHDHEITLKPDSFCSDYSYLDGISRLFTLPEDRCVGMSL